jgi:hypothetical protein
MSIQAPQGILNIPNAILRVGKLAVDEVVGADTILNTVARNTILLVDDEAYHENKNWSLKLPNAWAGEFECNTASAGNYSEFNFYNEGASSNVQGYNLTFNDTAVELRYDGTLLKTGTLASTITGTGVKKVRLMFERTILSVTVDGTLVFTHDDTGGPRPRVYSTTAGGFLNFFTDGGALKNLKIVNEKWISDGTSNIAYVGGGEVAVGQALAFNRVSNVSQIKVDSNVVTEYTGPHDRPLRKYPEIILPRAAVGADYNGYRIERSSEYVTGPYLGVQSLFNNTAVDYADTWGAGINGTNFSYSASTGEHTAYVTGGTTQGTAANLSSSSGVPNGEWVSLQVSTPIKLDNVEIRSRNISSGGETQFPKDFQFWGSNDGTTWYLIKSFTGVTSSGISVIHKYNVNSTTLYNRFALVVTKIPGETSSGANDGAAHFSISELRFNAKEEGSGSLDTTLKTVYNVPATTGTQLEVYYDGQDYSSGSTITDKVGNADATISSGSDITFDSTYKAWVFGGDESRTQTIKTGTLPTSLTGGTNAKPEISAALWFNPTVWGDDTLFMIANPAFDQTDNQFLEVRINGNQDWRIQVWDGQHAGHYSVPGFVESAYDLPVNNWYHLVVSISGKTSPSTERKVYLNGIECTFNSQDATPSGVLNLPTDSQLQLGKRPTSGSGADPTNVGGKHFFGSIANFRLYSKALDADQIKELYDYQKDYFLGSKSQVTLYKGHLGVGVTEPSGQLELAGDERIQEYPPRGMTNPSTYIEGHGVFKAYASSRYSVSSFEPWRVFSDTSDYDDDIWVSGNNEWYTSNGYPSVLHYLADNTPGGAWLKIEMPYKIKLNSFSFVTGTRNYSIDTFPENFQIWASNDGTEWNHIYSVSGFGNPPNETGGTAWGHTNVNSQTHYSMYAMVITKVYMVGGNARPFVSIPRWRLFGTPGPTTLDKGSLTLGRSLDVPRVSRYDVDTETPRPEKLVVDFDTTVNSSPTDISGKGNHGAFYNGAYYSAADKAFVFDGTNDYIRTSGLGFSGDQVHSVSLWFWSDKTQSSMGTNEHGLYSTGSGTGTSVIGGRGGLSCYSPSTPNNFRYWRSGEGGKNFGNSTFEQFTWTHCVLVYPGGGPSNARLFLNGVEQLGVMDSGSDGDYSFIASDELIIGDWLLQDGTPQGEYPWDGKMSNFKLYNVALEPSEVQKLYRLGRTGRSMVISDTAVGIGKVPEAQLDVRGSLVVRGGNVMIRQDDIQVRLATDPRYLSQIWGGSMFIANPSTSGGYEHFIMNNSTTGTHQTTYFSFRRNNGQIGSILTSSGSTINFNTGSDYRLKENIVPMSNEGLVVINKLQPKTFNFKTNPGETVYGFIAHELQEHIPMAVSGEKDEMRGEEPMYQGVDASKIVPWLVKAIQELYEENQAEKAKNETLETQVSDLLARVTALENA